MENSSEQLCPICQWPMERTTAYLESVIAEDSISCENCKLWAYDFQYGNIMYQIGGEIIQLHLFDDGHHRLMAAVAAAESLAKTHCWGCGERRDWMECSTCNYLTEPTNVLP